MGGVVGCTDDGGAEVCVRVGDGGGLGGGVGEPFGLLGAVDEELSHAPLCFSQ